MREETGRRKETLTNEGSSSLVSVSISAVRSAVLGLPEDLVDLGDVVQELLPGRRVHRTLGTGGARGLRGVIEAAMLDIMFEIPSKPNVKECVITAEVIQQTGKPQLVLGQKDSKPATAANGKDSAESA